MTEGDGDDSGIAPITSLLIQILDRSGMGPERIVR